MIEIDGVGVRFGDLTALEPFSLSLSERRIAVIGANGSGKSTFVRLLNGLVAPERTSRKDDDTPVLRFMSYKVPLRGLFHFVHSP